MPTGTYLTSSVVDQSIKLINLAIDVLSGCLDRSIIGEVKLDEGRSDGGVLSLDLVDDGLYLGDVATCEYDMCGRSNCEVESGLSADGAVAWAGNED
jgi:hypothetical protein